MYCFSKICRLCLNTYNSKLIEINSVNHDKVPLLVKLKYCFPEILNGSDNLPGEICLHCCKKLTKLFEFKKMCLRNTITLNKYAKKLKNNCDTTNSKLDVHLGTKNVASVKSQASFSHTPKGVTRFSSPQGSLDLFQAKFICYCDTKNNSGNIKSCKGCDGDLLGFHLANNRKSIDNVNNFKQQVVKKPTGKRFHCPNCDKKFQRRYNLNNHFTANHIGILHACSFCAIKFVSEGDLNAHMILKHETKLKRKLSEKTTNNNVVEINAEESQGSSPNSGKDFSCTTCNKHFINKSKYVIHLMTHVCNKHFACDICNKEFLRKTSLEEHKLTHALIKKYACTKCDKSYDYMYNLKRHVKSMHKIQSQVNKCAICNLTFDDKNKLEEHTVLKHTEASNKKLYTCHICDKHFNYFRNLKEHIKVHSDKNKSESKNTDNAKSESKNTDNTKSESVSMMQYCNICNRYLSNKTSMERHVRTHIDGKHFKCYSCKKIFDNENDLKQHLATHASISKYSCGVCSKLFVTKQLLDNHICTI